VNPGAAGDVDRVPHGGVDDPSLLAFDVGTNPRKPSGAAGVYSSAFAVATSFPMGDYSAFRTAAADYLGCAPRSVVPVAGGVDGLRLALGVSVRPGTSVLVPVPACGEFAREIRLQGAEPCFVPHREVLATDPAPHAAVVVANPNNPLGEAYDDGDLRRYAGRCREVGTTLVVDESSLGVTGRPSLAGDPGVVAIRSLTTVFGLPGLRAGVAVATGGLRDRLDGARATRTLTAPAVEVATYCLGEREFLRDTRDRVASERERLSAGIAAAGFDVHPSDSHLLTFRAPDVDAVRDAARARGIAVRDARTYRGLDSHVRVTVRLPDENDRLLEALRAVDGGASGGDVGSGPGPGPGPNGNDP
jgi:histidinol-phosphate/aromatic aminotransferase/cobyric acid decarboxylase-like protein